MSLNQNEPQPQQQQQTTPFFRDTMKQLRHGAITSLDLSRCITSRLDSILPLKDPSESPYPSLTAMIYGKSVHYTLQSLKEITTPTALRMWFQDQQLQQQLQHGENLINNDDLSNSNQHHGINNPLLLSSKQSQQQPHQYTTIPSILPYFFPNLSQSLLNQLFSTVVGLHNNTLHLYAPEILDKLTIVATSHLNLPTTTSTTATTATNTTIIPAHITSLPITQTNSKDNNNNSNSNNINTNNQLSSILYHNLNSTTTTNSHNITTTNNQINTQYNDIVKRLHLFQLQHQQLYSRNNTSSSNSGTSGSGSNNSHNQSALSKLFAWELIALRAFSHQHREKLLQPPQHLFQQSVLSSSPTPQPLPTTTSLSQNDVVDLYGDLAHSGNYYNGELSIPASITKISDNYYEQSFNLTTNPLFSNQFHSSSLGHILNNSTNYNYNGSSSNTATPSSMSYPSVTIGSNENKFENLITTPQLPSSPTTTLPTIRITPLTTNPAIPSSTSLITPYNKNEDIIPTISSLFIPPTLNIQAVFTTQSLLSIAYNSLFTTSLRSINLSYNRLSYDDIPQIVSILCSTPSLQQLSLANNMLTPLSMELLLYYLLYLYAHQDDDLLQYQSSCFDLYNQSFETFDNVITRQFDALTQQYDELYRLGDELHGHDVFNNNNNNNNNNDNNNNNNDNNNNNNCQVDSPQIELLDPFNNLYTPITDQQVTNPYKFDKSQLLSNIDKMFSITTTRPTLDETTPNRPTTTAQPTDETTSSKHSLQRSQQFSGDHQSKQYQLALHHHQHRNQQLYTLLQYQSQLLTSLQLYSAQHQLHQSEPHFARAKTPIPGQPAPQQPNNLSPLHNQYNLVVTSTLQYLQLYRQYTGTLHHINRSFAEPVDNIVINGVVYPIVDLHLPNAQILIQEPILDDDLDLLHLVNGTNNNTNLMTQSLSTVPQINKSLIDLNDGSNSNGRVKHTKGMQRGVERCRVGEM
jgi:hypothetical protein